MILADLPRLTFDEYQARFAGKAVISVAIYCHDQAGLDRNLPEARRMIRRRVPKHTMAGGFVITDRGPPKGVDQAALTVAVTALKD